MEFNSGAFKAWAGGVIAAAVEAASVGNGLGGIIINFIESVINFDIPTNLEVIIASGISWALGFVTVYFAENAEKKTA